MKIKFFALLAAVALCMSSCEEKTEPVENVENGGTQTPTPTPPVTEDASIILTHQTYNCIYRQGYEGLGADRYYFGLCDGEVIEDMSGTILPEESGSTLFWCAFYGAPAADPAHPVLPAGTYTLRGEDKELGNLEAFYTYIVRRDAEGLAEKTAVDAATVTVEGESGAYKITFDYTLTTGERLEAVYEGDVFLTVGTPLTPPTPWMEEDYDTEFVGVYANLMGASVYTKDADVIGLQLYDFEPDPDGSQTGGIVVKMELTTPELSGFSPMIPDGVYNVSIGMEMYSTPVGDVLNLGPEMGISMMGTTARLINEDGEYEYGAVLTGSVTVTTEGAGQKISVDFVTGDGVKITGVYDGPVSINGYSYTPPVSDDPFSTLTGDMEITADGNWSFTADYYRAYYQNREDVSFIRFRGYSIPDPNDILAIPYEGFHGFRFDLIVENDGNVTLPSGTYRPDADGSHAPMTFELASRESEDGGTYYYGSYGYLGYDFVGYIDSKNMGPVLDGSLSLTALGNGEYDISYNVLDDKGNQITFSYRGAVTIRENK